MMGGGKEEDLHAPSVREGKRRKREEGRDGGREGSKRESLEGGIDR